MTERRWRIQIDRVVVRGGAWGVLDRGRLETLIQQQVTQRLRGHPFAGAPGSRDTVRVTASSEAIGGRGERGVALAIGDGFAEVLSGGALAGSEDSHG